ncbi:MAG: two-component system sensor histidine kinase NtrB [Candidatus Loosdrechtia sp.]|uniref:two-component system sensor histidine kinase NtrB n=1 Tax=Candidatus Loosdrechtia sp. TaxID=3101272 RepID=UPI003A6C3547|nr:MAG: ATP-binding protein [Candidatus Jettenia sp. AMX2]
MIQYLTGAAVFFLISIPAILFSIRRAITKTRELEKRAMNSERLAFVGTLAGGLVHEIKNPLSTLNINLQLLKEDIQNTLGKEDERVYRKVQILQKEVQRLEEILNDFLRFARGKKLEPGDHNIHEVLDEVIDFVSPKLKQKNIAILKDYDTRIPFCCIDKNLIKQAILNIILNAEQAMENGGELMIHTRKEKKNLLIDITDTGSGMPEAVLDKIFQVYYSTKKAGTGLGLPTTKRIIEEHKGTISCYSEEGKGTKFSLRLPLRMTD